MNNSGLALLLGFIIGNDTARKWCIAKINDASRVLEKEFEKSPLGKMLKGTNNDNDRTKDEITA